ncbi:MAG TPA: hypothetical protein VFD38_03695 [Myxococcaceae bacterium]|nr:hypothetical protein [Myxococcaceae bacterium]
MSVEADGDGCRVRLEHGGWRAENVDQRAKFRNWPVLLRRSAALART